MSDEILLVKKKEGNFTKMKVFKRSVRKKHGEVLYQAMIDVKDYKALARVLKDLEIMFNAPIGKAIIEMEKKKFSYW